MNARKKRVWYVSIAIVAFVLALVFLLNRDRIDLAILGVWPAEEIRFSGFSLEAKDYVGELERTLKAIDRWYGLKEAKGLQIEALRNEFVPLMKEAQKEEEFFKVMTALFARLNNAHSNYLFRSLMTGVRIDAQQIEGKVVVVANREEQETLGASIQEGSQIVEVDGMPIDRWLASRRQWISASTDHWLAFRATEELFQRYAFEEIVRTYRVLLPTGDEKVYSVALNRPFAQIFSDQELPKVVSKGYGEIAYIAINTMEDGVVEHFDHALEDLLDHKYLIIDVRENAGGNSLNAVEIVRRLIQEPTPVLCPHITVKPYDIVNFPGRVGVLVGPKTLSAAESFVFSLQESGLAVFFGTHTGGDSGGGPVTFETVNRMYFRFPTRSADQTYSGKSMEGYGLEPDFFVEQTHSDFLDGRDTVLEYAIAFFQERTR